MWQKISLFPRHALMVCIKAYQLTFSPDHGFFKARFPHGYCPFFPSCSAYAYQAIEKNGVIRGGWQSLWRILRCHPWTKGGIDAP